jgi:hypothetical protein
MSLAGFIGHREAVVSPPAIYTADRMEREKREGAVERMELCVGELDRGTDWTRPG